MPENVGQLSYVLFKNQPNLNVKCDTKLKEIQLQIWLPSSWRVPCIVPELREAKSFASRSLTTEWGGLWWLCTIFWSKNMIRSHKKSTLNCNKWTNSGCQLWQPKCSTFVAAVGDMKSAMALPSSSSCWRPYHGGRGSYPMPYSHQYVTQNSRIEPNLFNSI